MTLDSRSARAFILCAWSAFLLWLWLTGEVGRYLGPRTSWVVPAGAVGLLIVTVAYSRGNGARDRSVTRIQAGEGLGLVALLVPIMAGALLANTQLGALAASKKLSQRGIDLSGLADLSGGSAHPDFLQVSVAGHNPGFAKESGLIEGKNVRLVGFVARAPARPRARFELARFYIGCCVADAVPIGLTIDPAASPRGRYRKDDWLDVTASLDHHGKRYLLLAHRIARVRPPHHPYLYFSY
jgi:uncharacterized repeat protein (TIGR03943 family)